jgi:cobalt-precorrin-5B (C1)-methyltransferase
LSILGTTGVVVPYSCSAWIHGIRQGIDVARAMGVTHVAGATGAASEAAVRKLHDLPEIALIDMGDFVGGMLKYIRAHPVPRVTIAGGVAKITKLAQGLLDLHSRRGAVDLATLARFAAEAGGSDAMRARIMAANTAAEAFSHAEVEGIGLGDVVARAAQETAAQVVEGRDVAIEVAVFDRDGRLVGRADFAPNHAAPPRNRRR